MSQIIGRDLNLSEQFYLKLQPEILADLRCTDVGRRTLREYTCSSQWYVWSNKPQLATDVTAATPLFAYWMYQNGASRLLIGALGSVETVAIASRSATSPEKASCCPCMWLDRCCLRPSLHLERLHECDNKQQTEMHIDMKRAFKNTFGSQKRERCPHKPKSRELFLWLAAGR